MNTQPIEKLVKSDGSALAVHSIFHTIQGEGPFSGHRAVFVRLAGCNLQCSGCDTTYTGSGVLEEDVAEVVRKVTAAGTAEIVVITGGEPFRQNISVLCNTLVALGYIVQVETNGTLPPSDMLHDSVVIVCSPKTSKVNGELAKRANCFKYVLSYKFVDADGLPKYVLGNLSKAYKPVRDGRKIYIQPEDSYNIEENNKNVAACIRSCMEHGYTLQLQLHKLIGVE
jgi:organic radical activating enzyme